jgi:ATP/maltotriose-dependent transcriptional regulator MalT
MALCDTEAGDLDAGRTLADEAARTFGDLGDAWGGAMVSLVLARVAHDQGNGGRAHEELGRARDIARRIGDAGIEVRVLAELAALEHELGETDDAERHARAVLSLRRDGIGGHGAEVQALTVLARLAVDQHDLPAARLLLEDAVRLKEHAAPTTAWRVANAELSLLLAAAGDGDAALRYAEVAADGAHEVPRAASRARQARAAAVAAAAAGREG